MAISSQAAIKKMIDELQQALSHSPSEEKTREHIRAVRLLCDLLLDEKDSGSEEVNSSQELQAMIGGFESSVTRQAGSQKSHGNSEGENNGDSIFDF